MLVSGFTFIRNAVINDYPIREAIASILPLCDEMVVALGASDDDTEALIRSIPSTKIRIVHTVWDDGLREGGHLLAQQTNIAFQAIDPEATWAIYVQGDEVFHEDDYEQIRTAMQRWKDDVRVEGLLFRYRHFYGSYDWLGDSAKWYRHEIRVVRNSSDVYSFGDAQGFRIGKQRKLRVKSIPAFVHHYGWVKHPQRMQTKQRNLHRLWHDDAWIEREMGDQALYDYAQIDSLRRYDGSHPAVMHQRIAQKNWSVDFSAHRKRFGTVQRLRYLIEKYTGYRIGEYKNYKRI